jgi:hypothetical protein
VTEFYVRIDEENKTPQQIEQRDRTYDAAKILRAAGIQCKVHECFTGKSVRANAAYITLEGIVP